MVVWSGGWSKGLVADCWDSCGWGAVLGSWWAVSGQDEGRTGVSFPAELGEETPRDVERLPVGEGTLTCGVRLMGEERLTGGGRLMGGGTQMGVRVGVLGGVSPGPLLRYGGGDGGGSVTLSQQVLGPLPIGTGWVRRVKPRPVGVKGLWGLGGGVGCLIGSILGPLLQAGSFPLQGHFSPVLGQVAAPRHHLPHCSPLKGRRVLPPLCHRIPALHTGLTPLHSLPAADQ
ncbi:hypothetical protein E2C01_030220 [Portunus trituberculatus]|uniref:Uncharacterized protein n=1 Tax=Portunus trituberculatus TaxID=210409 RepID=A0A5B7EV44_PORTR|nr:hypothetical protein [Portunus trituberculatus]